MHSLHNGENKLTAPAAVMWMQTFYSSQGENVWVEEDSDLGAKWLMQSDNKCVCVKFEEFCLFEYSCSLFRVYMCERWDDPALHRDGTVMVSTWFGVCWLVCVVGASAGVCVWEWLHVHMLRNIVVCLLLFAPGKVHVRVRVTVCVSVWQRLSQE